MITLHSSLEPPHPGEYILEDILPSLEISQSELARQLGYSRKHVNLVLNGKKPVTAEFIVRLSAYTGKSHNLLLKLQANYDLYYAQKNTDVSHIKPIALEPA